MALDDCEIIKKIDNWESSFKMINEDLKKTFK